MNESYPHVLDSHHWDKLRRLSPDDVVCKIPVFTDQSSWILCP